MSLSVVHDSIDDIPEGYRDLYVESDGKYKLTGIAGIKTQEDIDRQQRALQAERDEHKSTKEKLKAWGELSPEDVQKKLDRFAELELAAQGKTEEMDGKLEQLTEARVKSRLAPVERENDTLKRAMQEKDEELEALRKKDRKRTIDDVVRAAASDKQNGVILPEATPDLLMVANAVFEITEDGEVLTKENDYGITPGLSPDVWLQEMRQKRPHWWPATEGGGAKGSKGGGGFDKNPFSYEHWNMTKQGDVVRGPNGAERAAQMARAAGTTVGGPRPRKPA